MKVWAIILKECKTLKESIKNGEAVIFKTRKEARRNRLSDEKIIRAEIKEISNEPIF